MLSVSTWLCYISLDPSINFKISTKVSESIFIFSELVTRVNNDQTRVRKKWINRCKDKQINTGKKAQKQTHMDKCLSSLVFVSLSVCFFVSVCLVSFQPDLDFSSSSPSCLCLKSSWLAPFARCPPSRTHYHQEFPPESVIKKTNQIAFSHCCVVVIRFHFLPQSSEFYWPFERVELGECVQLA